MFQESVRGWKLALPAACLALGLLGRPAQAALDLSQITHVGTLWTVLPTGVLNKDILDIQYAINHSVAGETVLLKATNSAGVPTAFKFRNVLVSHTDHSGQPAFFSLVVNQSITLTGETTPDGHISTITGGVVPIIVSNHFIPIDATVTNIEVHNFTAGGISVSHAHNATVTNMRVTADTMDQRCYWNPFPGEPSEFFAWGIGVFGSNPFPNTGDLVVENNYIDFEQDGTNLTNWTQRPNIPFYDPYNPDPVVAAEWANWYRWNTWGIYTLGNNAPNLSVTGNTVRNYSGKGLLITGDPGRTVIDSNDVSCGLNGFHWGFPDASVGIAAGTWAGPPIGVPAQLIQMTNNRVTCLAVHGKDYVSNDGTAIWLFSQNGAQADVELIQNNQIDLSEGQIGISVDDIVGAYVGQNQLKGNGNVALKVAQGGVGDPYAPGSDVLVGNEIAAFRSAQNDVLFGPNAADNLLAGHSGSCLDQGTNNKITGCTSMAGGAGQLMQSVAHGDLAPVVPDVPDDDVSAHLTDADLTDSP
jgi:hypothetical protein